MPHVWHSLSLSHVSIYLLWRFAQYPRKLPWEWEAVCSTGVQHFQVEHHGQWRYVQNCQGTRSGWMPASCVFMRLLISILPNFFVLPTWSCYLKVILFALFFTWIHPCSFLRFQAPFIPIVPIVRVHFALCWTPSVGTRIPFTNPEFMFLNESSRFEGFRMTGSCAYSTVIAVLFVLLLIADSILIFLCCWRTQYSTLYQVHIITLSLF